MKKLSESRKKPGTVSVFHKKTIYIITMVIATLLLIADLAFYFMTAGLAQMGNFSGFSGQQMPSFEQSTENTDGAAGDAGADSTESAEGSSDSTGNGQPDMSRMPGGGQMPGGSTDGSAPDMSQMPNGGQMPDMSQMPGGSTDGSTDGTTDSTGSTDGSTDGSAPDMSQMPNGGQMPDMSQMPGGSGDGTTDSTGSTDGSADGSAPDMSQMPNGGQMPDMSQMPNGGSGDGSTDSTGNGAPDMSQMPNGGQMPGGSTGSETADAADTADNTENAGTESAEAGNGSSDSNVNAGSMNGSMPDMSSMQEAVTKVSRITTLRKFCIPAAILLALLDLLCLIRLIMISKNNKNGKGGSASEEAALLAEGENLTEEEREAREARRAVEESIARRSRTKRRNAIIAICTAAALVFLGIASRTAQSQASSSSDIETKIISAAAEKGSIDTTLSSYGTLEAEESTSITIPGNVDVVSYAVSNGNTVAEGDLIATVDKTTVLSSIAELQTLMDELDAELEDLEDETIEDTITAAADGRIMVIYAKAGNSVVDTMYENASLMRISLDGLLAADFTTDADITAGDTVTVKTADGDSYTGKVAELTLGEATITLTDDGPLPDEAVTIYDADGNQLAESTLYIHSEQKITGFTGTVKAVKVSAGDEVEAGDTLLTLTDTDYDANYDTLIEERETLESQMAVLMKAYMTGGIYAEAAGIVSGLDDDSVSDTTASASDSTAGAADTTASAADGTASVSDSTASVADSTASAADGTASAADGNIAASAASPEGYATAVYAVAQVTSPIARASSMQTVNEPGEGWVALSAVSDSNSEKTNSSADASAEDETDGSKSGNGNSGSPEAGENTTGENGTGSEASGSAANESGNTGSNSGTAESGRTEGGNAGNSGTAETGKTEGGSTGSSGTAETGKTEAGNTGSSTGTTEGGNTGSNTGTPEGENTGSTGSEITEEESSEILTTEALAQWLLSMDNETLNQFLNTLDYETLKTLYEAVRSFEEAQKEAGDQGNTGDNTGDQGNTGDNTGDQGNTGDGSNTNPDGQGGTGEGTAGDGSSTYPGGTGDIVIPGGTTGGSGTIGGYSNSDISSMIQSLTGKTGSGMDYSSVLSSSAASALMSSSDDDDEDDEDDEIPVFTFEETEIGTLTPGDIMTIDMTVDELDILSVLVNTDVQVTLDALIGQSFDGTITHIDTEGTNSGGNTKYTVTVSIQRTENMLTGMNANVSIVLGTTDNVLTIPEAALSEENGHVYVYTGYDEKKDTLTDPVEVTTGVSDGTNVEILTGLEEGDTYYYQYADSITYNFLQ